MIPQITEKLLNNAVKALENNPNGVRRLFTNAMKNAKTIENPDLFVKKHTIEEVERSYGNLTPNCHTGNSFNTKNNRTPG